MTRVTIGGPVDRIKVGLRVSGDLLDPNEVTEMLKCQPTRADKAGAWLLQSNLPPTDDIEMQLEHLLSSMTDNIAIWKDLTSRYIFCGLFLEDINRGFTLSSKMIKSLSERNISIGFDIYA